MKTHLQRRRFRSQAKIEFSSIDEKRVCDAGSLVLAGGLPVAEGPAQKAYIWVARIVVEVASQDVAPVRPICPEDDTSIEVDYIVFQREGEVRLPARAHQLVFVIEREDVIAQDIVAAIVLMKARTLALVDDVILNQDIARPLVQIDSPSSVGV